MNKTSKLNILKKTIREWTAFADRSVFVLKILSVTSVILFSSCVSKSVPKVYMKPSESAMSMELTKETYGITAIAVSKDGSYVLAADNGGAGGMTMALAKSTVRLWDISSGKLVYLFKADTWINHITFSPGGKYAALAGYEGSTHSL